MTSAQKSFSPQILLNAALTTSGLLCAFLGGFAAAGHSSQSPVLAQSLVGLLPIRFDIALAMSAMGMSLLFLRQSKSLLAGLSGAAVAFYGAALLSQAENGVPLGISVGLVMTGSSLLLASLCKRFPSMAFFLTTTLILSGPFVISIFSGVRSNVPPHPSITLILFVAGIGVLAHVLKSTLKAFSAAFLDQTDRLQSVLEAMGDGVMAVGMDGRAIFTNISAERFWGGGAPPDDFPLPRALKGEIVESEELHVRVPTRPEPVWISVSARPIKDELSKVKGAVAVFRDISEHKKTVAALRESQELFDKFMNNSPALAFLKDEKGAYFYMNQTFERTENVKLAEMRGKTDFDWLPDYVAKALAEHDRAVLEVDHLLEFVEKMPSGDGTMREWLVFKFPVVGAGNERFIGAVAMDISERRRAEEELLRAKAELEIRFQERTHELDGAITNMHQEIMARKRAEKELAQRAEELAASNRELENFAVLASHDLQEPLRKIASYGDLIADRYQGKLDEKADKFISYMVDGAHRAQKLIRDLLSYARAGRDNAPFELVDLGAVLQRVQADLEPAIREAGAELKISNFPAVTGNAAQMGQLFQNLISNALKFRGTERPLIEAGVENRGAEWAFSIRDNGTGIDRENLDRVFQIFQRFHNPREYPGSGIGLAVCKKIVEHHQGRIWIESEKGKGTTIYFTLPNQVENEQAGSLDTGVAEAVNP